MDGDAARGLNVSSTAVKKFIFMWRRRRGHPEYVHRCLGMLLLFV